LLSSLVSKVIESWAEVVNSQAGVLS